MHEQSPDKPDARTTHDSETQSATGNGSIDARETLVLEVQSATSDATPVPPSELDELDADEHPPPDLGQLIADSLLESSEAKTRLALAVVAADEMIRALRVKIRSGTAVTDDYRALSGALSGQRRALDGLRLLERTNDPEDDEW